MKLPFLMTSWLALSLPLLAQSPAGATAAPSPQADAYAVATMQDLAKPVIEQARKSPEGSASTTLQHYPDHFTMLAVRVKDGKAELHEHNADILIIVSGAATLITGGTVTAAHTVSEGEVRGDAVAGGTKQSLTAGSIAHIPASVPHQMIMDSADPLIYFVVKVKQ